MFCDYVPPPPRLEQEHITAGPTYVLGDWILTYLGREWRFDSWAVAIEFVATDGHLNHIGGS